MYPINNEIVCLNSSDTETICVENSIEKNPGALFIEKDSLTLSIDSSKLYINSSKLYINDLCKESNENLYQ